jgi:hypothetical protein
MADTDVRRVDGMNSTTPEVQFTRRVAAVLWDEYACVRVDQEARKPRLCFGSKRQASWHTREEVLEGVQAPRPTVQKRKMLSQHTSTVTLWEHRSNAPPHSLQFKRLRRALHLSPAVAVPPCLRGAHDSVVSIVKGKREFRVIDQ